MERQVMITDIGLVTVAFEGQGSANLYAVDPRSLAREFVDTYYCADDALTNIPDVLAQRRRDGQFVGTWEIVSAAPGENPCTVWDRIESGAKAVGLAATRREARAIGLALGRGDVAWYSESMGPDGQEGWVLL